MAKGDCVDHVVKACGVLFPPVCDRPTINGVVVGGMPLLLCPSPEIAAHKIFPDDPAIDSATARVRVFQTRIVLSSPPVTSVWPSSDSIKLATGPPPGSTL